MKASLQDQFAPKSICFGCGPINNNGLKIKSHAIGSEPTSEVTADFVPQSFHEAFPGMINGGIIGTLLDCHSNWTAAHALMRERNLAEPPCTVTADFHVKLRAPTPSSGALHLTARAVEIAGDRVRVEASLFSAEGKCTATCVGTFVAVKPGHPAYHRWSTE